MAVTSVSISGFLKGDRVVQTTEWLKHNRLIHPGITARKYGTVVGFSRDRKCIRVVIDGYKTPVNWSPSFWKLASTASYTVNAGCSPEFEDCKSELDAMDAPTGFWRTLVLFIRSICRSVFD